MSDQGYTPTEQEFVAAWIQAHQVPVGSGGWVDRESEPRERIAEGHRGIAEVRREAAEKAWVGGYTAGWKDAVTDYPDVMCSTNPYKEKLSNG